MTRIKMEVEEDFSSPWSSLTNCFICLQLLPLYSEEQKDLTNLFFKYLKIENVIEAFVCEKCSKDFKKFVELSIKLDKTRMEMDYILGSIKTLILKSKKSKPDCGFASARKMVAKKCFERMWKRQPQLILERVATPKHAEETPISDYVDDWLPSSDAASNSCLSDNDYLSDTASSTDIKPEITLKGLAKSPNERKKIKCPKCTKTFPTKFQFKIHNDAVHLRLRPFKCDICDKSFALFQSLKLHKATPHNPKRLAQLSRNDQRVTCEICEKSFCSAESLQNHKRKVHLLKKITCQICDKEFRDHSNLNTHISAVHEKQKLSCQVPGCDKTYTQIQTLVGHYRLHHPDSAVPRTPRNYPDHSDKYDVTNAGTVFECKLCGSKFKTRKTVLGHIRLLHLPKTFLCEDCGYKASQKCRLDIHIRNKHKHKIEAGLETEKDGVGGGRAEEK